jgi:hypothetical protein
MPAEASLSKKFEVPFKVTISGFVVVNASDDTEAEQCAKDLSGDELISLGDVDGEEIELDDPIEISE